MKVVYNACHGGFSLSEAGVRRYAELKGLTLFKETNRFGDTWWLVPKEQRTGIIDGDGWSTASMDQRIASNKRYSEITLNPREIDRADAALVQVVEELGDEANGPFAQLRISDVPAGSRYRIDEYDGAESVMTVDDYDWKVAI